MYHNAFKNTCDNFQNPVPAKDIGISITHNNFSVMLRNSLAAYPKKRTKPVGDLSN
jgi:hypothetical protein